MNGLLDKAKAQLVNFQAYELPAVVKACSLLNHQPSPEFMAEVRTGHISVRVLGKCLCIALRAGTHDWHKGRYSPFLTSCMLCV